MLHVTCHIAHVTCHMSNAYVDSWDMLNNFCFHVSPQKSLHCLYVKMAMLFLLHHHHQQDHQLKKLDAITYININIVVRDRLHVILLESRSAGELWLFCRRRELDDDRAFAVKISRGQAIDYGRGGVAGQLDVEVLGCLDGEEADLGRAGEAGENHHRLLLLG